MELLYVWCGKVNEDQIKGLQLNFGGRYKCELSDNTLHIDNNENYIRNFFRTSPEHNSNVVNISAIVGKNGAGKTSTIKAILKTAFNSRNYDHTVPKVNELEEEYVVAYLDNQDVHIFFTDPLKISIKHAIDDSHQVKLHRVTKRRCESLTPLSSVAAYYYSSVGFRGDNENNWNGGWKHNLNAKNLSPTTDTNEQIFRILEMLGDRKELREHVSQEKFQLPDTALISVYGVDPNKVSDCLKLNDKRPDLNFKSEVYSEIHRLTPLPITSPWFDGDKNALDWLKFGFNKAIYNAYVGYLLTLHTTAIDNNLTSAMADKLRTIKDTGSMDEHIDVVLQIVKNNFGDEKEKNTRRIDALIGFISYLRMRYSITQEVSSSSNYWNEDYNSFQLPIDDSEFSVFTFLKKYKAIYSGNSFTNIDIGIRHCSQGEYSFLDMLTALNTAAREAEKSPEISNVVYLIDEGDVFFHPQWEKQFISLLIEFAPVIFEGVGLQIILTSNKPVILSDLPSNNIIFLDKTDDNQTILFDGVKQDTFAQNIHTLYAKSFFVQDGLIGDFAKKKIKQLSQSIVGANSNDALMTLEREISMIGEPIIRSKLKESITRRRYELGITSEGSNLESEIQTLEARLKHLKRLRND